MMQAKEQRGEDKNEKNKGHNLKLLLISLALGPTDSLAYWAHRALTIQCDMNDSQQSDPNSIDIYSREVATEIFIYVIRHLGSLEHCIGQQLKQLKETYTIIRKSSDEGLLQKHVAARHDQYPGMRDLVVNMLQSEANNPSLTNSQKNILNLKWNSLVEANPFERRDELAETIVKALTGFDQTQIKICETSLQASVPRRNKRREDAIQFIDKHF